jgi:hypothetical protein
MGSVQFRARSGLEPLAEDRDDSETAKEEEAGAGEGFE